MKSKLFGAISALVLLSGPLLSVPQAFAQSDQDPPAAVARIAVINGTVSYHAPGSQDWQAAAINYPVQAGAGVWVEPRSHAAVDLSGARLHLDGASDLEVTSLDPQSVTLDVPQGAVMLRVYPGVSGQFEIDTPHGAARIAQPGEYEVVAGDDQHPMTLSVFEGAAQMLGQTANLTLQAGQSGIIAPDNSATVGGVQQDDFTRMVQGEEQTYTAAAVQTAQYVAPQETGYQDLSRYGRWQQSPQYGAVWYPASVATDWAPYRYGHWAYVAPWGWTWIDDAPWGFTPFHYGRWVEIGARWAWVPGERVARPVYAPALVSFFGDLGGIGINISVGWVPLGPDEVYVAPYRHSDRYTHDVNITNVHETKITYVTKNTTIINYNNYVNRRGATVASRDVMASSRDVGHDFKSNRHPDNRQWERAKPMNQVPFQPQANANAKRTQGPKIVPASENHQKPWQNSTNGNPNGNGKDNAKDKDNGNGNGQPKSFTTTAPQNGKAQSNAPKPPSSGATPYVPQPSQNTAKPFQPNPKPQLNGQPPNVSKDSKDKNAAPGPNAPKPSQGPAKPYQPNGQPKNPGTPGNGQPKNNQAPGPYIPLPPNGDDNGANATSPSSKYGQKSGPVAGGQNSMPAGKLMSNPNANKQGSDNVVPKPAARSAQPTVVPTPPKADASKASSSKTYANGASSSQKQNDQKRYLQQQQQRQEQQRQDQQRQEQQRQQQQRQDQQRQQQQFQKQHQSAPQPPMPPKQNNAKPAQNCNTGQGNACGNN